MTDTQFDIAVIGGGPGGYVAAIRAAQLGLKPVVIERENLGGICLNWGCIPTKALLRAAELRHSIDEIADFGITVGEVKVDLAAVVKRSRKVAGRLSMGVKHLLNKNKVTVIAAEAKLGTAKGGLRQINLSNGDMISAKHVIIATGARARALPDIEANGKTILSYREAMVPETMPESLIIVGSGAIGSEFASFYFDMGVKVTLVEALDRILPVEDEDVSAFVQKSFEKRGIKIMTGVKLQGVTSDANGVQACIEGQDNPLQASRMILAVGITGNTENLGLEATKIKVDRGHIVTDQWGATGEAGVYAIGDVTGPPGLRIKPAMKALSVSKKSPVKKMFMPLARGLCLDAPIAVLKSHQLA